MTERIYDGDSHQKTFQAAVLRCEAAGEGWRVALDRTCFFPEGGGQFGDRGTLTPAGGEPVPVTDTQEEGDLVWHYLAAPIPEGTAVEGALDWPLRFARMQCHSGEHIVSGLFHARDGVDNVGFHLGDEEVILDLSGPVPWEEVQEVERLANEAVSLDLPVSCAYPPEEALKTLAYRSKLDLTEHVRIVTIPGYDVCACCAPHVNRTGEIGLIHFLSSQNWKGGVRLRMLCGSRAVEDVMAKQNSVAAISARLSAHQSQVVRAVERQSGELEAVKQENARLGRLAAQALGVEGARIAKTLSFKTDDGCMLILAAGDARIDNRKFKDKFHMKAKMLSADEVQELVGHPVGGVCPFGCNEGIPVYLDESLKRFTTVFPAVGSASSAIELNLDELFRYSKALEWIDVCKLPEP